jgi:hypothetical protein
VGHLQQFSLRTYANESHPIEKSSPSTLHTQRTPMLNEDAQSNSSTPVSPGLAQSPQNQHRMHLLAPTIPCGPATSASSTTPPYAVESYETPTSPYRASISLMCNDDATHTDVQDGILPPISDCFCPPEIPTPDLGQKSKGIHCKAAVDLVAGMQHSVQVDEVKGWLRCSGSDDCEVQSSRLFQLMDKIA